MRISKNKVDCCGCTACVSICSHSAIKMMPDALGFLYPEIDDDKCVDCGLCEQVCSFKTNYNIDLNLPKPLVYAARHKDLHEVETSQSGAAFIAFSDWILNQGGVVYGAGYSDHFRVIHKRAVNPKERDEFKGSKYVQSDMNVVFSQVNEDLKNGLVVLFSGTPCQTSGLSSFIGKKYHRNLYLIDIICHGVPSPFIWQNYLGYLKREKRTSIISVNFRDKSKYGWHSHVESYKFADSSSSVYKCDYTRIFYSHISLRYSCGSCPFTNTCRPSDITIADFWGVEKTNASILATDNKGCSMIMLNTAKAKQCFEYVQSDLECMEVKLDDCLQPNMIHPSKLHSKRDSFEQDYKKWGFEKTMKKYGFIGWKNRAWKCEVYFKQKISVLIHLIKK